MAVRQRHALTTTRPAARMAGMVAVVVALHLAGLEWLARHHSRPPTALQSLAEPMFTRMLVPAAPPPPAPGAGAPAPAPRVERPTITALADAAPRKPPPEKAAPPPPKPEPREPLPAEPVQPEPAPPEPVAEPPPPEPMPEPPDEAKTAQAPQPQEEPAAPPPVEAPATPPSPTAGTDTGPGANADATAPADPKALDRWPRDSRLSYSLTGEYRGGPLYGSAQVQWQRQGPLYQVRVLLDISLAGSRVMTSQGVVTPEGLVPHVYEETRNNNRRAVRMEGGQLRFENGTTQPSPPGVQDSASQFVELGYRFATGREALQLGGQVKLWLARPSAVDLWTYDVVETELLRTPRHGEVEAFRLKPRPLDKARGNITAEIWFAPTLQYLPVRIRVRMGDEAFVDLMVETIEQR